MPNISLSFEDIGGTLIIDILTISGKVRVVVSEDGLTTHHLDTKEKVVNSMWNTREEL